MKECRTYTRSLYFSLAMDDIQVECPSSTNNITSCHYISERYVIWGGGSFEADVSMELQLITNSNTQDV